MFASIAGKYDFLNRLFSFGTDVRWRRELAAEVRASPGVPVLDVATGTADVALTLTRVFPGSLIVGTDFTLPMLRVGASKVRQQGAPGVRLAAGDAYRLPFRDDLFGTVTIAFGLRNLAHRADALREMSRVLRPGGRLVILEFSPMTKPVIGAFFRFYFHWVMPWVGGIISGDRGAYRYLPESVDRFPDPHQLGREMTEGGLTEVRYRPLTMGIAYLHTGTKKVQSSEFRV